MLVSSDDTHSCRAWTQAAGMAPANTRVPHHCQHAQVLRRAQPRVRRQVPGERQVVLQRPHGQLRLLHHRAPGKWHFGATAAGWGAGAPVCCRAAAPVSPRPPLAPPPSIQARLCAPHTPTAPQTQVKSKSREVSLHKDSALGEAVLECYASGNRNVFSLGFVPVAGDNTVVLLARDTPGNSPAVRDLGVDMSQVGVSDTFY